jgi:hypothetical protein
MAKANGKPTTRKQSPDASLIAMIVRHDELWAQWDRLAKLDEDDPRISALSDECSRLEPTIIATPAYTKAGLAAKRRLIAKVGYASVNGSKDLATGERRRSGQGHPRHRCRAHRRGLVDRSRPRRRPAVTGGPFFVLPQAPPRE